MRCCRKRICGRCVTQVLRLNYGRKRWHTVCPFCRHVAAVTQKRVKKLLHDHAPDHAKVIESDVGPVAIIHNPSPDGRYDDASTIDTIPTVLPEIVDELIEEVEQLSGELAGTQEACKRLEKELERRRAKN